MITTETLDQLARQHRASTFPNIVREYVQHLFLAACYRLPEAEHLLFKGGTALRIVYGSPRFSEDLDFSLVGIPARRTTSFVEGLFVKILAEIERIGIHVAIGAKSHVTRGGYFGVATCTLPNFQPVAVAINVAVRGGRGPHGEVDSVANDFVPTYTVVHLPHNDLVEEKIFGALQERKKPRDFYDLYFMMRKGMLSPDHKKRLAAIQTEILGAAQKIDFRGELGAFLPIDQQAIIRDFLRAFDAEFRRQIS